MRDQAFAWLAEQVEAGVQIFTVDEVGPANESCDPAGKAVWRELRGTFQAPLFLTSDPFGSTARTPGFLQRDARGKPVWHALTAAPYGIAIPCAAAERAEARPVARPRALRQRARRRHPARRRREGLRGLDFVAGGTNWSGLSSPDVGPTLLDSFIVR